MLSEDDYKSQLPSNYEFRNPQYNFYKNAELTIIDDKYIINRGGCGIGKTYATSVAIDENIDNFDNIIIVIPTSSIRKEWIIDLNNRGQEYVVWISKSQCCKFGKNRYGKCIGECPEFEDVRTLMKENKGMTITEALSEIEVDYIKHPIDLKKYYSNEENMCLYKYNRIMMMRRKIFIGDYNFIATLPLEFMLGSTLDNACVIIDEIHLFPSRLFSLKSIELNITKFINFIKRNIGRTRTLDYLKLVEQLERFETFCRGVDRATLNDFKKYVDVDKMKDLLKLHETDEVDEDEISDYEKLLRGYMKWERLNIYNNFSDDWQYVELIGKNKDVKIKIVPEQVAVDFQEIVGKHKKTLFNSGTIQDEKYFNAITGFDENNTIYTDEQKGFEITEFACISNDISDNLTSPKTINGVYKPNRYATYAHNKKQVSDILRRVTAHGNVLIYIQSRGDYNEFIKNIDDDLKSRVVDFTAELSQEEYDIRRKDFCNENIGHIGVAHINGKVEGQNFIDDDGELSVVSVIIYGFPFPYSLEDQDRKRYFLRLTKSDYLATQYAHIIPAINKVHQAIYRAKRSAKHNPFILLIDSRFTKNQVPRELVGCIGKDIQNTLSLWEKKFVGGDFYDGRITK